MRLLASIVDSSHDAILNTSLDGIIQSWNPAAQRLFGYSAEEVLGHSADCLVPADRVAEERRIDQRVRCGETVEPFVTVRVRSDGRLIPVSVAVSPIRDGAGALIGASSIVRDQRDERIQRDQGNQSDQSDTRIEEALHRSELRYRRLFETTRDGILILDAAEGRVVDVNPFLCKLLAASPGDLIGKPLWEVGLWGDRPAVEGVLRQVREKGECRYDGLTLEAGGQRREVEIIARLYRESGDSVIHCNVRDVTERRRLERQTREQSAALSDLHHRKDEFVAMLSHELRNPLAPISNAVQLLRLEHGNATAAEEQARTIIERQVAQMSHLIDDLLEVSRITTGKLHLHCERLDLAPIVERAVETARLLVAQHRQHLTVSLPVDSLWLDADAARLEQVLDNLLDNASKYTDEGGDISLLVEQENETAVLRVRDNGVGIAPDLLPRIFDVFTQAQQPLDRSEGGLGVGLSLVRRLIELHGGTVEAHSAPGKGSEFVVRLPLVAAPGLVEPTAGSESSDSNGSRLRVLVVDDNVDAAESLAMLLSAARHGVLTIHDGSTVLAAALHYRPDVVLLDIGLPGLNGFEVAKQLRQQAALDQTVLVAMTGYGQETDRQQAIEAGFDHHLVKPADFDVVLRILDSVAAR